MPVRRGRARAARRAAAGAARRSAPQGRRSRPLPGRAPRPRTLGPAGVTRPSRHRQRSVSRSCATAWATSARLAASFVHALAPEGWGSGTITRPSRSKRRPTTSASGARPIQSSIARRPTGTTTAGSQRRTSASVQGRQRSRSPRSGARSPRPPGTRPGIALRDRREREALEHVLVVGDAERRQPGHELAPGGARERQPAHRLRDARRLAHDQRALPLARPQDRRRRHARAQAATRDRLVQLGERADASGGMGRHPRLCYAPNEHPRTHHRRPRHLPPRPARDAGRRDGRAAARRRPRRGRGARRRHVDRRLRRRDRRRRPRLRGARAARPRRQRDHHRRAGHGRRARPDRLPHARLLRRRPRGRVRACAAAAPPTRRSTRAAAASSRPCAPRARPRTTISSQRTRQHLAAMLEHGATTIEVKSGYGLDAETEHRHAARHPGGRLRVGRARHRPPAWPRTPCPRRPRARTPTSQLCIDDILPDVAEWGLAEAVDVFCERGAFDVEQARRYLEAGREHGLALRLHGDQFAEIGALDLAIELGRALDRPSRGDRRRRASPSWPPPTSSASRCRPPRSRSDARCRPPARSSTPAACWRWRPTSTPARARATRCPRSCTWPARSATCRRPRRSRP